MASFFGRLLLPEVTFCLVPFDVSRCVLQLLLGTQPTFFELSDARVDDLDV
jgi:hypothetical protein